MVIPRCCSSSLNGGRMGKKHTTKLISWMKSPSPVATHNYVNTHVESRKRSFPASFAEMMPLELTKLSESLQRN